MNIQLSPCESKIMFLGYIYHPVNCSEAYIYPTEPGRALSSWVSLRGSVVECLG